MGYGDVRCKHLTGSIVKADIKLFGDIPKKIKCKRGALHLEQVYDMLDKAFDKCDNLDGLVLHSDQG